MKARTVLVTGATGLLGSALVRAWADRYRLIALSHRRQIDWPNVTSILADLVNPADVEALIADSAPDLVVHCAAWTDVDGCERDADRAMAINSAASGRIAAAAARGGSAFIYVSTDSVFDGSRGVYAETDAVRPLNQYSASKLAGEKAVLASHPAAIVARVSLEGWRPVGRPGFVQWVVESLRRGDRLTICTDWVRSIVFASNVPAVMEAMWIRSLAGIYHVAPASAISNFDLALMTARIFALDSRALVPISGDELHLSAPRPKNTSLDGQKLTAAIGRSVWEIEDGLVRFHEECVTGAVRRMAEAIGETALNDVR